MYCNAYQYTSKGHRELTFGTIDVSWHGVLNLFFAERKYLLYVTFSWGGWFLWNLWESMGRDHPPLSNNPIEPITQSDHWSCPIPNYLLLERENTI